MATDRVLITFHVTSAERDIIRHLARGQQSAYLRALCRRDAAMRGVIWPGQRLDDTRGQRCPQCGGYNIGITDDETKNCADCGWHERES